MPTLRFIRLGAEEDARLREIEQDPCLKPKVRLRAQVLRLSNRGATIEQIAAYTSRSRVSVGRDFETAGRSTASWGSPTRLLRATHRASLRK